MNKRLRYRRTKGYKGYIPAGGIGRITHDIEQESLSGEVQGLKASMIEERFARALQKKNIPFQFRLELGAGRNQPGFKELDFLVERSGMFYAVEIDTAFTHRQKQNADVLHDAIVLNELKGLTVYPKVFHIDGDKDLAVQKDADKVVENFI